MSTKILEAIKRIAEDNENYRIVIFTNHLKIEANIFFPEEKCEECLDDYLALKDVNVCRISDYCECNDNNYNSFKYNWFNISIKDIVAFSVIE